MLLPQQAHLQVSSFIPAYLDLGPTAVDSGCLKNQTTLPLFARLGLFFSPFKPPEPYVAPRKNVPLGFKSPKKVVVDWDEKPYVQPPKVDVFL